jgi:hypothetical protein
LRSPFHPERLQFKPVAFRKTHNIEIIIERGEENAIGKREREKAEE